MGAAGIAKVCRFTFGLPAIPAGKSFCGVEVAHRGRVQLTEAQVGDAVHLTLGG